MPQEIRQLSPTIAVPIGSTAWSEYPAPNATTDRGWLKAITEPFDPAKGREYTHNTMPVFDEEINNWREQSTLGNYLDYGPVRPGQTSEEGFVHAVCYASKTSKYCKTVAEAKSWIEQEAKRVRPELQFQTCLHLP